jgi:hypothetical protein
MYAFTNQFSGPSLRQRVGMMNGQRSGSFACWRYGIWMLLMGAMALACRHSQTDDDREFVKRDIPPFSLTNATRVLAAELEKPNKPWWRMASLPAFDKTQLINGRKVTVMSVSRYPEVLCIRNYHLSIKAVEVGQTKLFINGSPASAESLSSLTFEEVADLFIYQKWADMPGAEVYPETYRIFISTTHKTQEQDAVRVQWKQFMQANAVSDFPLGHSSTFSMNKLLEATFFHNKLAFVERTKNEHLRLYDAYRKDIELFVNGIRVDEKQITDMHVREVDKLYTRERPFDEWADGPDRKARYVLYIQTAPKRAKRDSTYYVFSPFYSGDF